MKNLKITIAAAALFIFSVVIFYGCKKTATSETKEQNTLAEFYRQKLKNEPTKSILAVNLPGKGYYGDINGNRITVIPGQTNRPDASSCPDPRASEFTQSVTINSEYTCGTGYRFLVQFTITSEFYPLLTNSSGLPSKGRIRLVNSSGGQVYITPTSTVNPVISIQNNGVVGQNSNGDDLNEFIVVYRSEIVSEATYNLAAGVQSNLTCYTDCVNYATLNIGFSPQQQAVAGSQHTTQPCTRIDKVYWNPRSGSTPPSLAGANPTGSGCFPWGYVFPHKQEVEFKNGAGQWKRFYLHYQGLGQPGTECPSEGINYWDVWYIDVTLSQSQNNLVPGNVQVRYRNNHMGGTGNGAPCVTQPTGTYITETWYIN
ncbi:MAG: hypothetical protein V9F02_16180 [Chitinophagaceae bacterium]|jgi:hypothetical protein